jgi:hypothetical protein
MKDIPEEYPEKYDEPLEDLDKEKEENKDWDGWDDKQFVLAQLQEDGLRLKHAHPDLKKDTEIVNVALDNNGLAIQYAYYLLTLHEDLVTKAIMQNPFSIRHVGDPFQIDRQFVHLAIHKLLSELSKILENDQLNQDSVFVGQHLFFKEGKTEPLYQEQSDEECLVTLLKKQKIQVWVQKNYRANKDDVEFIVDLIEKKMGHGVYLVPEIPHDKNKNSFYLTKEPLTCTYVPNHGEPQDITFHENDRDAVDLQELLVTISKLENFDSTLSLQNILCNKKQTLFNELWDIITSRQKILDDKTLVSTTGVSKKSQ